MPHSPLFIQPFSNIPHPSIRRPTLRSTRPTLRRPTHPVRPRTSVYCVSQDVRVSGGGVAPSEDAFTQYDGQDPVHFASLASDPAVRMVPVWRKIFSDQMTPVVAYRCLVAENDQTTPSFLLESVHTGERVGRYSLVGARPVCEVVAYKQNVTVVRHERTGTTRHTEKVDDPWKVIAEMNNTLKPVSSCSLPAAEAFFSGGWVGYGGYDTMRYAELKSLPFSATPKDDRGLPDLHFGLYKDVFAFDQVAKVIYIVHWVDITDHSNANGEALVAEAHAAGMKELDSLVETLHKGANLSTMSPGTVNLNTDAAAIRQYPSNMTKEEFMEALSKIKYHIMVGDTFQTVFSQRFERWSEADPFSVYRALRIINPSPYMIYMQNEGSILVASSPEILTKVENGTLTNRPLAGTRRRGASEEEDEVLAKELLADGKDRSEHMMLVDLGRNDVGKVSAYGSVKAEQIMNVEKYSHVMHISSTVKGKLREGLTSWDALRATLPAGTISGAPKIRAMQIIDDLEPTKRGPYGGGIGYISFHDSMNIALALRTMVVPTKPRMNADGKPEWQYFLQAGAGIVYESDPEAEYTETVNKAMAMNRAIDLAENAF
ncbi:anthranilate synthase component I [Chondrus crispus]|uniref:anthranilate synthase n=1 Tax=Chondrus crispus TaxID=2769 RepID=R7Q8N0_CHOCR|nr:anthranilate synthase component I [Chondrus crispus]CDF34389.1 anthranilate synthase component I [Chondrus crispus]|eukprot:XP_005714208.1 anthranilate synthase component I [Chondrus crispus]